MNDPKWEPGQGKRINLVTDDGLIVGYVEQLWKTEWAWDVLRYANAAGRTTTRKQAEQRCLSEWKRCSGWTHLKQDEFI